MICIKFRVVFRSRKGWPLNRSDSNLTLTNYFNLIGSFLSILNYFEVPKSRLVSYPISWQRVRKIVLDFFYHFHVEKLSYF